MQVDLWNQILRYILDFELFENSHSKKASSYLDVIFLFDMRFKGL